MIVVTRDGDADDEAAEGPSNVEVDDLEAEEVDLDPPEPEREEQGDG